MTKKTKTPKKISFRAGWAVAPGCDIEGGQEPDYVPLIRVQLFPNGVITLEACHTGNVYYTRRAAQTEAAHLIRTIRAALATE